MPVALPKMLAEYKGGVGCWEERHGLLSALLIVDAMRLAGPLAAPSSDPERRVSATILPFTSRLVDQLSRLAGHLHDVADALAMTVQRIRAVPAHHHGQPA